MKYFFSGKVIGRQKSIFKIKTSIGTVNIPKKDCYVFWGSHGQLDTIEISEHVFRLNERIRSISLKKQGARK